MTTLDMIALVCGTFLVMAMVIALVLFWDVLKDLPPKGKRPGAGLVDDDGNIVSFASLARRARGDPSQTSRSKN